MEKSGQSEHAEEEEEEEKEKKFRRRRPHQSMLICCREFEYDSCNNSHFRHGEPGSLSIDFSTPEECCVSLINALEDSVKYHVLRKVLLINADEVLLHKGNDKGRRKPNCSESVDEKDDVILRAATTFCINMLQFVSHSDNDNEVSKIEILRQVSHLILDLSIHVLEKDRRHLFKNQDVASSLFNILMFSFKAMTVSPVNSNKFVLEPRAVLRTARIFCLDLNICDDNVSKPVADYVECLMNEKQNLTSAVGLIIHFRLEEFATRSTIEILVDNSRESLAEELSLVWTDLAAYSVTLCRAYGKLKAACRIAKNCSIQNQFPNLENEYRESTVRKLVNKGQYEIAVCFVLDQQDLQSLLMELLIEKGCSDLALECHKLHEFSCPIPVIPVMENKNDMVKMVGGEEDVVHESKYIEVTMGRQSTNWLKLDVNPIFVDNKLQVQEMIQNIKGSSIIAIDTEWKPDILAKDNQTPHLVALLQVAVSEHVFVVDMISLNSNSPEALEILAFGLFSSDDSNTAIIGFNIIEDIRRLRKCLPLPEKIVQKLTIVELEKLAKILGFLVGKERRSLSDLSFAVLGQQICKVLRMTDWEKRPLTAAQMTYAALDARCLLMILNKMKTDVGKDDFQAAWIASSK